MKKYILFTLLLFLFIDNVKSQDDFKRSFACLNDSIFFNGEVKDSMLILKFKHLTLSETNKLHILRKGMADSLGKIEERNVRLKGLKRMLSKDSLAQLITLLSNLPLSLTEKDSLMAIKKSLIEKKEVRKTDRKLVKKILMRQESDLEKSLYITEKYNKETEVVIRRLESNTFTSTLNYKANPKLVQQPAKMDTFIYNNLVGLMQNSQLIEFDELWPCAKSISAYVKKVVDALVITGGTSTVPCADCEAKKNVLSENFYMRVYTDARGFNHDEPNGLLQTEFGFSWRCKNCVTPWKWKGINCKDQNWNLFLFKNIVLPYVNLFQTKRDSSFRFTPVNYQLVGDTVNADTLKSTLNMHTLNLIKYARYSVSGKINLFTLETANRSFGFLMDVYGVLYSTGVRYDTITLKTLGIKKEDDSFQIYSVGGGISAKAKFYPPESRWSMEASYTSFRLLLLSNNDIRQKYGPLFYPIYNKQNYGRPVFNAVGRDRNLGNIAIYVIQVRYSSDKNALYSPTGSGTFLRFTFYTNPLFSSNRSFRYGNNYMQVQLGITRSLKDLFDFLKINK